MLDPLASKLYATPGRSVPTGALSAATGGSSTTRSTAVVASGVSVLSAIVSLVA